MAPRTFQTQSLLPALFPCDAVVVSKPAQIGAKETSGGSDGGRDTPRTSVGTIKEPKKSVPQSESSEMVSTVKEPKKSVPRSESAETNTGLGGRFGVGSVDVQPQESGPTVSRDHDKWRTEAVVDIVGTSLSSSGSCSTLQNEGNTNKSEGLRATTSVPGVGPNELPAVSSQQQQQQRPTDREAVLQAEVRVDEPPAVGEPSTTAIVAAAPTAETTPMMMSATESGTANSRGRLAEAVEAATEQRAVRDLEESCGSLEGDSAHSRWSLPNSSRIGGIGAAGGLHEQLAVWAGGQDNDSVGTVEQAPSSVEGEEGGRGEDGKSPSRSRVESYDLKQEPVRTGSSEDVRKTKNVTPGTGVHVELQDVSKKLATINS